jgi:alkylation response protein AidB-like acyl-CoA dehydrogenase
MPGFNIRKMKTQGGWSAGTAFIEMDDVEVPVENRVGAENAGFKIILENFNHERFAIAAHALRSARLCIEESVRYARQRKTFGKRLIDHQVIRFKIAEMVMKVESTFAYEEQVAYQMQQ